MRVMSKGGSRRVGARLKKKLVRTKDRFSIPELILRVVVSIGFVK